MPEPTTPLPDLHQVTIAGRVYRGRYPEFPDGADPDHPDRADTAISAADQFGSLAGAAAAVLAGGTTLVKAVTGTADVHILIGRALRLVLSSDDVDELTGHLEASEDRCGAADVVAALVDLQARFAAADRPEEAHGDADL